MFCGQFLSPVVLGVLSLAGPLALASEKARADLAAVALPARPLAPALPPPAAKHPLLPILKFAREEQDFIAKTVRDFTCRVTKRERIAGELQEYIYLDLAVRQPVRLDQKVATPYGVYVSFLGPQKVRGRRVLFVEGENEGKLLVRNGGQRFSFVTVKISPDSEAVKRESQVPITDLAFDRMLLSMVGLLQKHIAADPQGTNTKVKFYKDAKINERLCKRVQIVHPEKQSGLDFHMANVYLDDKLHVPVRLEKYLWPEAAGQEPPLDAEFTYTRLVINPGLSPAQFTRDALRATTSE